MAGRITLVFSDITGDRGQVTFEHACFASDGTDYQSILSNATAFRDAVVATSDGVLVNQLIGGCYTDTGTPVSSADPDSDIGHQWRCYYQDDTTGRRFTVRIPTGDADLKTNSQAFGINRAILDLGSGVGATLKGAWDGFILSEDGNATTLTDVEYITRAAGGTFQ